MRNGKKDLSMMPFITDVLETADIPYDDYRKKKIDRFRGEIKVDADDLSSRHIMKIMRDNSMHKIRVSAYSYRMGECIVCFRKGDGFDIAYEFSQVNYLAKRKYPIVRIMEINDPDVILRILDDKQFTVSERIDGFIPKIKLQYCMVDKWKVIEEARYKYPWISFDGKKSSSTMSVTLSRMKSGKLRMDGFACRSCLDFINKLEETAQLNKNNKFAFSKKTMDIIYAAAAKEKILIAAGHGKKKR